jgi:hypothetical protein
MDTLNDIISGLKWGDLDPVEAHDRVLALFSVSQRSELLFALLEWIDYGDGEDRENIVDRFLKDFEANNCG